MNNSTPNYPPFIQRMIEEKEELNQRLQKLEDFAFSPKIKSLSNDATFLLGQQYHCMREYSKILSKRISLAIKESQAVTSSE